MERLVALALLVLGLSACGNAASAEQAAGTCWLDAMSDAEKRALVLEYAELRDSAGQAAADAWVKGQQAVYRQRSVERGACPDSDTAAPTPNPIEPAGEEARILNDDGKPCKRIELENQNVPNVGGSMGWALVPVCKD